MTTRFSDHLIDGTLAARPAANTVPVGTLYSADDGVIYQSDGTTWAAWATLSGGAAALDDLTDVDTATTAPADGDTLVYDLASGLWVPGAPAAGGGSVAWTTYTPTLTNGTVGNGTITGRYRVVDGKTVHWQASFVLGSTSSIAAGPALFVGLPAGHTMADKFMSAWHASDASTGQDYGFTGVSDGTLTKMCPLPMGTVAYVISNCPFTWAAGDKLAGSGTYEIV